MRKRLIFLTLICLLVLSTALTTFTWASTNTNDIPVETSSTVDISEPIVKAVEVAIEQTEIEEPEVVDIGLTDEEIDLIALVTMAEAEGESELGKRLVIDTILNRIDHAGFDKTATCVIYAPGQFDSMHNGRVDRCEVRDDIRQLVIEEATNRTNSEVLFFRTMFYHDFGTPILQEGAHYFSGL